MKRIWKLMMIFLGLTIGCNDIDTSVDKAKLLGNDYRLFQGTPIWDLAKAVEKGDTSGIVKIIARGQSPNLGDPRFGGTLLMMAVRNNNYSSALALLKHGADPNQGDTYSGSTAMHDAAKNDDLKYLKLLLSYKGNPNAIESDPTKPGNGARETLLNNAITFSNKKSLEKVILLVNSGVNVDGIESGIGTRPPIADAITVRKMNVLLFLLQRGADYNKVIYKTVNGHDVYILEALRKCLLDLQSPAYQKKHEVIAFLKVKGLDYYKEPIPDYILKEIKKKYPKNWKDYAERY